MINDEFENLINEIKKIKGLNKKTAERMLIDFIENKDKLNSFIFKLEEIQKTYGVCEICFYYTFNGQCFICSDPIRNQEIICVVATINDAINIENNKKYKGLYAILGGEINLVRSVSPDRLHINEIFKRLDNKPNTELILALNSTFEGEVTANYIGNIAKKQNIKVSRIAKGIPTGGMIDYMDESTLESAFNNRKKYGGKQ
ncbi:recombination protein RecR [Williamsoniiplasma somnilux]|uniref:Recombination protein RecR n=1 Tax=Williamsoniiplasma somnilux TaxID=215578 RepID=A0A2K8NZ59_9MOLU|nr:recombination mediator RecR [Williamsoniiplasma somnilux]ATZ19105.1 recombination protein RecR [Williamsoniiplasma somnilux]